MNTPPNTPEGKVALPHLVLPLAWYPGPATPGGDSTAGSGAWWDGDLLLIVIHHPDSRTVAMVQVSADEHFLNMIDPNTQDDITEWDFEDIAWWAKIEDCSLPTRQNAAVELPPPGSSTSQQDIQGG